MGEFEDALRQKLDSGELTLQEWQAEWEGDAPPISEHQLRGWNLRAGVNLQSQAMSLLALSETAREELDALLRRTRERQPARLEARVFGPHTVTEDQLLRELPEQVAVHAEVLAVLAGHLDDGDGMLRAEIEDIVGGAPVPTVDDEDLMGSLRATVAAHREAMLRLAAHVDKLMGA